MKCSCCGRMDSQISRHHLIPRSRHRNKKTKRLTRAELNQIVNICPPCHNQIHAIFSEKELERDYYNLKEIKSHPAMVKFLSWIKNKPADFKPQVRRCKK